MKPFPPALAGMTVLIALVSAHQQTHPFSLLRKPPPQHHVFRPLTLTEKGAAVSLFHLNLAPTTGNTTYTLTAGAPLSTPLGATLSANGSWYNEVAYNEIMMGSPDPFSWAQVFIAKNNPQASYTVTFNVIMTGSSAETFTLVSGLWDSSGIYHANPVAPTVTVSGTASIPIVLPPGYNTADLDFTAQAPNGLYLESVTIQQY